MSEASLSDDYRNSRRTLGGRIGARDDGLWLRQVSHSASGHRRSIGSGGPPRGGRTEGADLDRRPRCQRGPDTGVALRGLWVRGCRPGSAGAGRLTCLPVSVVAYATLPLQPRALRPGVEVGNGGVFTGTLYDVRSYPSPAYAAPPGTYTVVAIFGYGMSPGPETVELRRTTTFVWEP